MKNRRIFTVLVLFALGVLIAPFASAIAEEVPVERYVLNIKPEQYPGIGMNYQDFLHEYHVETLARNGIDCTACHYDNDESTFMGVSIYNNDMDADERRAFVHNACSSCHMKNDSGPSINQCRSCHSPDYKPHRGFDAIM